MSGQSASSALSGGTSERRFLLPGRDILCVLYKLISTLPPEEKVLAVALGAILPDADDAHYEGFEIELRRWYDVQKLIDDNFEKISNLRAQQKPHLWVHPFFVIWMGWTHFPNDLESPYWDATELHYRIKNMDHISVTCPTTMSGQIASTGAQSVVPVKRDICDVLKKIILALPPEGEEEFKGILERLSYNADQPEAPEIQHRYWHAVQRQIDERFPGKVDPSSLLPLWAHKFLSIWMDTPTNADGTI